MNDDRSNQSAAEKPALRSVHTASFAKLLSELGSSVLVTTYQAGKLIVLRHDRGVLNTHFRDFVRPMGLAVAGGKLAIGTSVDIQEFHNVPAVCAQLDLQHPHPGPLPEGEGGIEAEPKRLSQNRPQRRGQAHFAPKTPQNEPVPDGSGTGSTHDACFLPRRSHTTGDVQIHEMAWIENELWFVNTAFSCLSTCSNVNSFEVRWRPPFIDQLVPADCCHLNGLAVRDGRPAYVTALGATNTAGGWPANKRDGGVLIEIESGEIVARGLSMPHSPRWYRNRLWLLESGDGSLGAVDLSTGR
jgi:hypothetical protein